VLRDIAGVQTLVTGSSGATASRPGEYFAGKKWMESGDFTNRKHGFNSEKWRFNHGFTIQNRDLTSRNGDFI
jgi:hypothetical protein